MMLIIFYIIPINILFLQFIADIDNLGAFFYNINTQVIQIQFLQSYLVI